MLIDFRKVILTSIFLVLSLLITRANDNHEVFIDLKIRELATVPRNQLADSVEQVIFQLSQYDYAFRRIKLEEIIHVLPHNAIDAKLMAYNSLAEFSIDNHFSALNNALKFALENGRKDYFFDYYLAKASWFYNDQQYDSSLVYALQARQILPKNNAYAEVKMLHMLGDLFFGIQLYDQSEAYYRKAKSLIISPKYSEAWRGIIIDNNLGLIEMTQGKYDLAYESFSKSKNRIATPLAYFQDSLSTCYYNRKLALCIYHLNGDPNLAIDWLRFSYYFSKKYSLSEHLFPTEELLIRFFIRTNQLDSVKKYYSEFVTNFPLNKQRPEEQAIQTLLNAEVNEFFKDTDRALMYYKQYTHINDSLNLHVKSASVVMMLTEQDYGNLIVSYEHIKSQRKQLFIVIVLILSLILVIVYYFIRVVNLNKKLATLNQTKDKLFSIISHDLRSPFNALLGFSELLNEALEKQNFDLASHFNAIIQSKSDELYQLTNNLLHWSRSQQEGLVLYPNEIHLEQVINTVLKITGLQAESKSIKIAVDETTDTICYVDENVLITVLTNLISNAIKFSHVDGTITLKANYKDQKTEISIIDQGIGMSHDRIINLFKLATNQSTNGTNNEKGTGLGLIICKEFIEKSNGTIQVESQLGQGSTFIITLPTHPSNN